MLAAHRLLPSLALGIPLVTGCCAGGACSSARTPAAPTTPSTPSAPEVADYEVHEWGLVRAEAGRDVLRAGAVAPAVAVEPLAVDKPVLYFHTREARTLASVRVEVEVGAILETWPFVIGGRSAEWIDVRLDPDAHCEPSPLPTATDAPCSLLPPGAFCESPGLGEVRTTDATCVQASGTTERFLFYRAEARAFTPPLRFARDAAGAVTITNDSDLAIPGVIVRIAREGSRAVTHLIDPPTPHASVSGNAPPPSERPVDGPVSPSDEATRDDQPGAWSVEGEGRDAIERTMRELGLTSSEAGAFLAAWDATLFGGAAPAAIDVLTADETEPAGPIVSYVYFLPEAAVDGIARVSFEPRPRAFRRAFAVWLTP
jgi:hypothetical protein